MASVELGCEHCGHAKEIHDTGWDASGCMYEGCSCRCWGLSVRSAGDFVREVAEVGISGAGFKTKQLLEAAIVLHKELVRLRVK